MDKTNTKKQLKSQHSPLFIRVSKISTYIFLFIGIFIAIYPFFWMLSTSLMTIGDAQGTNILPPSVHFENYIDAWKEADFSLYMWNSVRITLMTLAGELTFSIMAAYAFARIKFPGKDLIFAVMLSTMMVPAMVTIIPNFLTVSWLGRIGPLKWINNWPALTIPFMGSVFAIFLLRQFFAQIPDELYDAAQIDGAGHLRFLWSVVMPLSKAPILVIVILSFIGTWNALAWPLLVTNTADWRPISVGLFSFIGEAGQMINLMMAGAFIAIFPILVLYFFTQKQFTESISRSGLKG